MEMDQIIEIIKWVVIIGLGALSYYLKTYTNVSKKVANLIAEAEEMYKEYTKAGEDKMAWCIAQLNTFIPKPLKIVLTDEVLRLLIQNVFDSIQDYINVKKIELADKINEKVDKIDI